MKKKTVLTILKGLFFLIAFVAVLSAVIVFVFPEKPNTPESIPPQNTVAGSDLQIEQSSSSYFSSSFEAGTQESEPVYIATISLPDTFIKTDDNTSTTAYPITGATTQNPGTSVKTEIFTEKETPKETISVSTIAPPASETEPPPIFAGFEDSRQIVLAVVNNTSSTDANIYFYEKTGNNWTLKFSTDGRVGKAGIAPISTRMQSSNKTPAGVMRIIGAFGLYDNPGAKFEYLNVEENMYWDLNSDSPNYNRLVYEKPTGEYERLADYNLTYKYALITDYNIEQQPGKGGAIFIHCNGLGATQGCVSMPLEYMRQLVMDIDPASHPVIIVTLKKDVSSYVGNLPGLR